MAVYYTIKCPHCNKTVDSGKNKSKRFGSPLCRCRFCGGIYVDKDYIEAGLLTENQLKLKVLAMYSSNLAFALLSFVCGLIAITQEQSTFSIVCTVITFSIAALLLFSTFRDYNSDIKNMQKEIDESNARLANPYYLLALHKANFSIPQYMIEKAMKEVSKEESPHN